MQLAPGDIVKVETDSGPAYVQVTHRHVAYPEVVRSLKWAPKGAEPTLGELAQAATHFVAMVPLGAAISRGTIKGEKLGSTALPDDDKPFPTFKTPIRDKQGGIAYWWFWDGEGLSYSVEPKGDLDRYPTREVLSAERFLALLAG